MTERTLLKQTRVEEDNISITSSQSEAYTSDQEFLVERILAEKKGSDGKKLFLILWANYPTEKSTWEPKKNIQDPDILSAWNERKEEESRGLKPVFNVTEFDTSMQELLRAKEDRHRRRKVKRKLLGIAVSPDHDETRRRANDSDSTDADEYDEAPEDDLGMKKKSEAFQKGKNPNTSSSFQADCSDNEVPQGGTNTRRVHYEGDGTGTSEDSLIEDLKKTENRKKVKRKARQAIRDKRATQASTKPPTEQDKPALKKAQGKSTSRRPGSSSSSELPLVDLAEQRRQSQQRSESTDTTISKQLASIDKSSPRPLLHTASSAGRISEPRIVSATASSGTRGGPAGGGSSTSSRGRGATRGGSALSPKNVFSSRGPPKKRPTLIENAANTSKDPKHFTNWHMRRKAELASRERADAAPDVSALGGLFRPSDPSTFQSLKPVALRKSSIPATEPQTSRPDISTEIDDLFVSRNTPTDYAGSNDWNPVPDNNTVSQHNSPSQASIRPQYQKRHGRNAICIFWYKKGDCTKGYECEFKHTNDAHLPIGPAPRGHSGTFSFPSHYSPPPTFLLSRPPWDPKNPLRAICYYYHNLDDCRKGGNCKYIHSDDMNLPIAPAPGVNLPKHRGEVCRFWASGYCEKPASICMYLHGHPEAPDTMPERANFEQQPDPSTPDSKFNRTCRYWKGGRCVDSRCPYWHSGDGSDKVPHLNSGVSREVGRGTGRVDPPVLLDGAVTMPTGPRKSVSFVIEEPAVHLEEHESSALFQPMPKLDIARDWDFTHPDRLRLRKENTPFSQSKPVHSFAQPEYTKSDKSQDLDRQPLLRLQTESDTAKTSLPVIDEPKIALPTSNRDEISMDNYRRKTATKALGDRAKEIAFGIDEIKFVLADVGDLAQAKLQPWGDSFAALTRLHFTQRCLAQDFQDRYSSLIARTLWQGSLASNETDQEAVSTLDKAWEHLRLSSAGFVSVREDFIVLVYPAVEEWKFIEGNATFSPEMRLRYIVFQSELDFSAAPETRLLSSPTDYRKTLAKAIHNLNFKTFVPKLKPSQTYHFYLLFPSSANKTADLMTNWLRVSSNQVKIYNSHTEGSWNAFIKDSSVDIGCVLIHESAIVSMCELPSLRALFDKNFTFWYVAEGAAEYPMYGPPEGCSPGQITSTRILPHGHAFLLTPSFLIGEPDRALYIIRWFLTYKLPRSTPGTWKLVCAHNIRDYLLELALEKSAEKDELEIIYQGDPRKDAIIEERGLSYALCKTRFQLHELIADVFSHSDIYSDYDSDTPDESYSPIIYASEFVNANDEQALVAWFAGWAMCKLDQFRKFTVVGSSTKYVKRAVRRVQVVSKETSKLSSAVEPVVIVSQPANSQKRRASLAEFPVNAAKARAFTIAAKLSSAPTTPSASKAQEKNPFDVSVLSSISEAMQNTKFLTTPQEPPGGSVESLGGRSITRPRGEVVGSLDNHAVTLPQHMSSTYTEGSDVDMTIDSGSSPELLRTKHGIDTQASPETLQFILVTGSDLRTASTYLSRSNNNLQAAVNAYASEVHQPSQLDGVDDSMDIDKQVSRAIEPYGAKITTEPFSPRYNNDGPPQLDGLGDERPRSSVRSSATSSRSGIYTDENGRRVVPASMRASDTVRPELPINPGYVPFEDRDVYRNPHRRVEDGEASNGSGRNVSQPGAPAPNPAAVINHGSGPDIVAKDADADVMDIDSNAFEESGTGGGIVEKEAIETKEIQYEATMTWYTRWYKEGRGWEHIYVDSWEKAIKYLGVK